MTVQPPGRGGFASYVWDGRTIVTGNPAERWAASSASSARSFACAFLLRADGSRKPAYEALDRLVNGEWWLPPTPMRADAHGRVEVAGARGEYIATLGEQQLPFSMTRGATDLTLVARA